MKNNHSELSNNLFLNNLTTYWIYCVLISLNDLNNYFNNFFDLFKKIFNKLFIIMNINF